jgi:hypothetical protein
MNTGTKGRLQIQHVHEEVYITIRRTRKNIGRKNAEK